MARQSAENGEEYHSEFHLANLTGGSTDAQDTHEILRGLVGIVGQHEVKARTALVLRHDTSRRQDDSAEGHPQNLQAHSC